MRLLVEGDPLPAGAEALLGEEHHNLSCGHTTRVGFRNPDPPAIRADRLVAFLRLAVLDPWVRASSSDHRWCIGTAWEPDDLSSKPSVQRCDPRVSRVKTCAVVIHGRGGSRKGFVVGGVGSTSRSSPRSLRLLGPPVDATMIGRRQGTGAGTGSARRQKPERCSGEALFLPVSPVPQHRYDGPEGL